MILLLLLLLSSSAQFNLFAESRTTGGVILKTKFANLLGTVNEVEILTGDSNDQSILTYHAFRGVPYAEAPTGNRRWQDPVVKRPLSSHVIYNATKPGSQCPQWISSNNKSELLGHEDCLYADVFIPIRRNNNHVDAASKLLKILVFFHGGGFIVNADRNKLPLPLLRENVMVITFNYRINIFGYLSTGRDDLPGNYGPLDQIALLKWVQLYGGEFGGDVTDVTVFGSSIGAVSIHYLLLTPRLATGLFHKAIMESGSALCERSMVPNPLDNTARLGSQLNCPSDPNYTQLVNCLRTKSTMELMVAAKVLTIQWSLPSVLGPVIDKHSRPTSQQFLPDYPEKLPVANKVPVVAGITRDEGLTAFVKLSKGYSMEQLNDLEFIERFILPHYLNLIMRSRNNNMSRNTYIEKLTSEVIPFYKEQFKQDAITTLVGILGDLWINTCHQKTVESLCAYDNTNHIYAYLFTHHDIGISPSGIDKPIEDLRKAGINHPIFDIGVAHTEEILYMMLRESDLNKLDHFRNAQMSKLLSSLWSSFAHGRKLIIPVGNGTDFGAHEWTSACQHQHNQHQFSNTNLNLPLQEISLDSFTILTFRTNETSFWWNIHQDTFSN